MRIFIFAVALGLGFTIAHGQEPQDLTRTQDECAALADQAMDLGVDLEFEGCP